MTVKELLSKYIKELDSNEICRYTPHIHSDYFTDRNRPRTIKKVRKFLHAIENFELPLHKKLLLNTLYIAGLITSYLLVCATFVATIISFIAIISITPTTLPFMLLFSFAIGTTFLGVGLSMLGCIFTIILDNYLEKQIIPIWNDDKIKQECKKINALNPGRLLFNDRVRQILNRTKTIIYNLEQQEYNISTLLFKKTNELINKPKNVVLTNRNIQQNLNSTNHLFNNYRKRALHSVELANNRDDMIEIRQVRGIKRNRS